MDASGGLIPPSDDAPPERKAQFQALMDEMEEVKRRQSTAEYIRPRDYRRKGQENKDARARKRAAVVAKTAEAARLTRLAKAGGEPAKTGRKYSEEFMDLQHMKDSDEDYKPGDMKTFTRARKRRIDAVSRRELVAAAAENRAKAASQAQILEESVMDASLPDDSFQIDLEGGDTDLDGDVDASAFVQSKGLDVVEPEQSKQAARRKETPEEKAARIQSLNELYDYESKEELLGDRANGDAAFWETDPSSPVPAPKAKAAEPIDLLDSPARNAKQQKAPRASISAILNEPDSPEAPEDLGYVKAGRAPEALDAAVLLTIAAVPDGGYEATGAGDERGYTCKLVYGNGRPDLIVSANSRPEMWNWYITWGHLLPDSCGQSVPWDVASPAKEASRQAAEETVWQKLFPAKPRPSTGNDVMRDDNVSLQATEVQEASEDEDFDVESGAKLPFRPTTTAAPPTAAPAAGAAAHQAPPSTRRHVRFDSDDEVIVELREDVGRMGKDNGSGGLELGQPPAVDPRYVADQEPAETSGAEGSGWRRAGGARSGLDGRNASGSGYANGVERGRGRGKHGPGGRHAGGRHLHGERGGGRGRHHGEHRGGRYGLSEHGHMVNNISRMILGSLRKAGGGDGSNSRRSRRHQESRRGEKKGGQVDLTDDFTS